MHLINEINKDFIRFSANEYCSRIVQRILESCSEVNTCNMADKILKNFNLLICNDFGTFVICSLLQNGNDHYKDRILLRVSQKVKTMGLDKNGSKLLENCIKMNGTKEGHKH